MSSGQLLQYALQGAMNVAVYVLMSLSMFDGVCNNCGLLGHYLEQLG